MEKKFTDFLQTFYDHGFLRKVYASEVAIVCNVYNQFYIAIDRQFVEKSGEKYRENIPCFIMNSYGLKRIVEDDSFVTQYYKLLSEKDASRNLMWLNEKIFQSWAKRDAVLKQKATPDNMDLAFEATLLEKGVEAARAKILAELPPKKTRFVRFLKKRE